MLVSLRCIGLETQNRRHDLPVVANSPEAWCVPRSCIDLKTGAGLFRKMPRMVVSGGEFKIHTGEFHFLGGVLDAQIGETDLAGNNGKVQLACKSLLHPLCLTLAPRLRLAKFSVEFFLEFVVELNPKYLATFAFGLVGSLLI